MAQQSPAPKIKELRLPMSRVKTIMKSSPHVESIGQDGLFLVTKATEMFVHFMAEEAHKQSKKSSSLDYKHLAEVVQTNETLEFLKEIMPRKITVRQFKQMMADKEAAERSSSEESSTDSDSDSQSDSESSSDSSKDEAMDSGSEKDHKENGNSESNKSDSSNESGSDK
ncbi:chromatin accessibility complex protein 1 [Fopius arisanus]|uniref:Chromatin accessibility complex protein 1 n=1 Tax=Fopius arisanus TaxID=64838 RepID=A0A9R1TFL5_9HYME|nr:PREDICTED: chromatin accessibility complex protein 1 [Fopius arisanus]